MENLWKEHLIIKTVLFSYFQQAKGHKPVVSVEKSTLSEILCRMWASLKRCG